MLARVATFAVDGIDPSPVWAEVDIRPGLPAFTIVGLGDAAVREARERVRAALLNSGFEFPQRRITANLAPAHLRKAGPGFDLALAAGVLAASSQVPAEALGRWAVFGELSLGGELRGCHGALSVAEGTRRAGLDGLILARERAGEAALVEGILVAGVRGLREMVDLLVGRDVPSPVPVDDAGGDPAVDEPDLADVRGQGAPVRALEVAAAGGHNLLFEGPPGTGKTMLARRLPSILPPLTRAEAVEVTRIHSVAGLQDGRGLVARRPFRAPHHTISAAGLVGGGPVPRPGEASLAHHGVLFLDELSEFARPSLEALRQPLEDGRVTIVRRQLTCVFPTRFLLVAATNPCPCGFAGDSGRCTCGEPELARHRRRLSGPLLDRLDILIGVERVKPEDLTASPSQTSAVVRERVLAAREREARRLEGSGATCNGQMDARAVRRHVHLEAAGQSALLHAYETTGLSTRGHHRVLRVARTLADLDGTETVGKGHVLAALGLRQHEARPGAAA